MSDGEQGTGNRDVVPGSARATAGRWLAIDLGDRRVGLAISDPDGIIASPAGYVDRRPGKRPPLTALLERVTTLEARAIVVGLPLDGEGEDTPRTVEARRLAEELEKRTGLPTRLVDERFTTSAALGAIREMDGSTRGRKGDVDALAATMLLQHAMKLYETEQGTGNREQGIG